MQLNVGAGYKNWTPYVPPPKPKKQTTIPPSVFMPAVFYTPKGEVTVPQAVKTVVSGTPQLAKKVVQTVTKPKTTTPPKPAPKPAAAPKAPAAPPPPKPVTSTWSAPAPKGGYTAPAPKPAPAPAPSPAPPPPPAPARTPQQATPEVPTTDQLMNDVVLPVMRQVQELFASIPDDSKALLAQLQSDYLAQLDALQSSIMKQFQEQLGGVDPATQYALQSIREQAAQLQNQLEEEMNRRGLLQSGIWIEARTRLQSGQLSAEQALLADRVRSLQDQMNQALMTFAQARLNAIQNFGLEGVRLAEQRAQTAREAISAGLQAGLSLADLQRAMQEAARNYGLNLAQFDWQKQQDLWQRQQAEKQLQLSERELEFEQKKWQDQLALERQRLARSASSGGGGSGSSVTAQLLAALPSYGTREAAIADIQKHAAELRSMGVNVDALLSAAMQLPSGLTSGGFGGGTARGVGATR